MTKISKVKDFRRIGESKKGKTVDKCVQSYRSSKHISHM